MDARGLIAADGRDLFAIRRKSGAQHGALVAGERGGKSRRSDCEDARGAVVARGEQPGAVGRKLQAAHQIFVAAQGGQAAQVEGEFLVDARQSIDDIIDLLYLTSRTFVLYGVDKPTPAMAEKRVALVVGNNLYPNLPADRQLQRALAVARALMLRPRLMLLDEPSFGLAPLIVRDLFGILGKINREEKVTILVVEQNAQLALEIAQQAYVIETGRIVMSGKAQDIATNEDVRKSYLGY